MLAGYFKISVLLAMLPTMSVDIFTNRSWKHGIHRKIAGSLRPSSIDIIWVFSLINYLSGKRDLFLGWSPNCISEVQPDQEAGKVRGALKAHSTRIRQIQIPDSGFKLFSEVA